MGTINIFYSDGSELKLSLKHSLNGKTFSSFSDMYEYLKELARHDNCVEISHTNSMNKSSKLIFFHHMNKIVYKEI